MKKILASVCLSMFSLFALAQNDLRFPGWMNPDINKVNEYQEYAIKNNMRWAIIGTAVLKEINGRKLASYEELCAIIDKCAKENNITSWEVKEAKKSIAYERHEFVDEAWAFCQKHPSGFDRFYILNRSNELNFTPEMKYDLLVQYALNSNESGKTIYDIVDVAIDLSIKNKIDSLKVKNDLQLLNRKLSKKLLKNKADWEPVIALIRTSLSAF